MRSITELVKSEGVNKSITTVKNGVSGIERFHKTVNEKLSSITSEEDMEDRYTKFSNFTKDSLRR